MGNFRGWEIVVILLVILLLFGWKRLPDATRSVGRSMRIFKSEVKGLREDDDTPQETGYSDTQGPRSEPRPLPASSEVNPAPEQAREGAREHRDRDHTER